MSKQGKHIGYIRVSTVDQNPERQLDTIKLDKTFIDHVSGKSTNRPQLTVLLDYVREDDTVIIHSMDRLARNVDDLKRVVRQLNDKQVTVQFIKEGLTFTGDDTPLSQLMLTILGAVAQFERELILERQREGIALAKKRGAYKGRKPLSKHKISELKTRIANGEKKADVARDLNIGRTTLYKYLE